VSKVLRIPIDDAFGLSQAFAELTSHDELTEIFASHSFIRAARPEDAETALRSLSRKDNRQADSQFVLNTLFEQLQAKE
jgi:hypothetical protein